METELKFCVGAMPPFSSKNVKQMLTPLELCKKARMMDGKLVLLGPYVLKYKSLITGSDQLGPLSDALVPGTVVQVSCVVPLSQRLEKGRAVLQKKPVPKRVGILKSDGSYEEPLKVEGLTVQSHLESGLVVYKPFLEMMVIGFKLMADEWKASLEWEL
ncbi:MAG TPA: hypothetical protein VI959_00225, partial [Alphaproteobacteria bacterium]|nr:hypothetical protein [Alphaproteobacteria bacterium]